MTLFSALNGQATTKYKKLTTTNATDIYEATTSTKAALDSISFANITGTAATVSLMVNDGTTTFYILKDYSVPANTTHFITDHSVRIIAGSKFQVQAGTVDAIDVALTLVELTGQLGGR